MLVQLVSIRVLPEHRDRFIEAFRINCEGSRREPGNLRFDLLCDPEDENSFSVYEVFTGPEALHAHVRTEHYRRCVEMITPICVGQRTKRFFTPVLVEAAPGSRTDGTG
ncbi:antibiotic biosynthesis monooxygenase [Paracoccus marinaquae]|uniref:Antibiotic biosynthesis monooxygenase n=1 Tax=Paracoccus marinaquae TaxID=2841926 RepID=A0ABS6AFA4_9RHOB|nr:antibiotic biosynthesis monooxygenase [Paracoccus marinaquae]MBU3029179.1 antibiotic biosynthesis monooxygenase [Paracoccus marinaquae]